MIKGKGMTKTHVYISEEFAEQIKAADGDKRLQVKVIDDIIKRKYNEIKFEMDTLDEQLLQFKLIGTRFEKSLADAYEEQETRIQGLIDKISSQYEAVNSTAKVLARQIAPLTQEVDSICGKMEDFSKRINSLNTYSLKEMLDIVERIANLDDKSRDIILNAIAIKQ